MKPEELFTAVKRGKDVPETADFSVSVTDETAKAFLPETVFVSASTELDNGDVGIFAVNGRLLCRQYCEDSFGNVYLLTLDRTKSAEDMTVKPGDGLVCFGRVLLKNKIPLR